MQDILLLPPIAFIILLIFVCLIYFLASFLSFKRGKQSERAVDAYSCGEEFSGHMIQPDYSQFFPFAFFFTILHVVALVIATAQTNTLETFAIAIVYIAVAIVGLSILLRR